MKVPREFWFFARLAVGLIFAAAGFSKLMDPIENFQGSIAQYDVIPYVLTPLIARVLPWIEFLCGSLFLLGYAPKWNAAVLGLLCLGFLLVLGSSDAFLSSGGKSCGCFGEGSPIKLTMHQVFFMDVTNLLLCIHLFRLKKHPLSLDQLLNSPR